MAKGRKRIPKEIERAVLIEAGHRCAIPTCRAIPTEIAHIEPWSKVKQHLFENLIALCPNCHTRADQKKEIDKACLKQYKKNLAIINNRYNEFERRIFEYCAQTGERLFVLGLGGDLFVGNAVKDGFFVDKKIQSGNFTVTAMSKEHKFQKAFPLTFTYFITDTGIDFIKKYISGIDIY